MKEYQDRYLRPLRPECQVLLDEAEATETFNQVWDYYRRRGYSVFG